MFHTLFHMKDDQPMPGSGVVVQVSQENLEAFRDTLSSGCNHQFGLILQGNTSLESFNAGSSTSTADESCRALEGTVCSTEARARPFGVWRSCHENGNERHWTRMFSTPVPGFFGLGVGRVLHAKSGPHHNSWR